MKNQKLKNKKRKGQVMLLSIILIGGSLLTSGAVAGLLTIYQLKQSNNVVDSTKAFFAADAMLEWKTYDYVKTTNTPQPNFTNGSSASATIRTGPGQTVIQSEGTTGDTIRTLESIFIQ